MRPRCLLVPVGSGWGTYGIITHRRTIEDHVEALVGAGFLIEAIREPEAPPESWEVNPRRCKENMHCPQFMLIKAVRDPRR